MIHTLKEYLEIYLDKKFILNDFAKSKNVSTAYLIAKFKEYYHCTPYEYLVQCRIDSAINMLKYTHLSIKEIASLLNFNDQYYFSNLFKERVGMSPKKFREIR
jgi:iron complex transport system substrate-binding protein